MKVKAKFANGKFGFYGGMRRRDGDVFNLEDPKHFDASWMEKAETRGRKPRDEEVAETEGGE